jgi:hypothetical protein
MYLENQSHCDWEMSEKTQRKFAAGAAFIVGFAVLMNLIAGTGPSTWDQLRPGEVAHHLQLVAR